MTSTCKTFAVDLQGNSSNGYHPIRIGQISLRQNTKFCPLTFFLGGGGGVEYYNGILPALSSLLYLLGV